MNNSEILIDLGSIAKGYITDKLADFLEKNGIEEFLIDSRGDICVRGKLFHILGIQHPRKKGITCSIKIKNQAVATSGDYMQYSTKFEESHIINQKDFSSITIVAPTLEEADVYATAIFTSSKESIDKLVRLNNKIKVLIIDKSNNLKMMNGFGKLIIKDRK